MITIIQRVDESSTEFAERSLIRMAAHGCSGMGEMDLGVGRGCIPDGLYSVVGFSRFAPVR